MSTRNEISFYKSVKDKAPSDRITIMEFCRRVRDGFTADGVSRVRAAITEDKKKAAKMRLPAVQLSGCVTTGDRAKAMEEGRFTHSGFLQIDVDRGGLNGKTEAEAKAMLANDPHVLSAFISPSGEGAKALFKIKPCVSVDEHKLAFAAVEKYILEMHGLAIDESTNDAGRLCYIPSDSECTWNGSTVEFVAPIRKQSSTQAPASLVIRSKGFPAPPVTGIHTWLMEAAWHCRLAGMSEADTVAKLQSYDGSLRRPLQATEAQDAARAVFSTVTQSHSVRAAASRLREMPLPADFPDLTKFGESDADNALRVHAVAGGDFHHVAESGQWLVWDGCRWSPDKDGMMIRLFLNVMNGTARQGLAAGKGGEALVKFSMRCRDRTKVMAGLEMLKSVRGVTIAANDLDADPWTIGTPGGLIDLRTGQPIEPDKRALVTKSIACDFEPEAACPTWERVIYTAANGDAELIRFLQAWTGYTLTGSVKEECLAFLHGTGANSKGTVTECIRTLLGDYAITAPESLFIADRNSSATNDIARLSGCRMACAAELDESASFAESRLKAITGRDAITARFLHREFFDFQPTHKFWISGNHKPSVRGVDHGIWRRIRLIPFTVTIPKEERDLELADKLRAELPGILNWAIAGCLLWQREGLKTPQCVATATADYQAAEDVVGQFLDDATDTDTTDRTLQSALYQAWQRWTEKQGIRKPMSARDLNRKLEERGLRKAKVRGVRFWQGITLKSEEGA